MTMVSRLIYGLLGSYAGLAILPMAAMAQVNPDSSTMPNVFAPAPAASAGAVSTGGLSAPVALPANQPPTSMQQMAVQQAIIILDIAKGKATSDVAAIINQAENGLRLAYPGLPGGSPAAR